MKYFQLQSKAKLYQHWDGPFWPSSKGCLTRSNTSAFEVIETLQSSGFWSKNPLSWWYSFCKSFLAALYIYVNSHSIWNATDLRHIHLSKINCGSRKVVDKQQFTESTNQQIVCWGVAPSFAHEGYHSFIRKPHSPASFPSLSTFSARSPINCCQSAVQIVVVNRIVAQVTRLLLATDLTSEGYPSLVKWLMVPNHFFPLVKILEE